MTLIARSANALFRTVGLEVHKARPGTPAMPVELTKDEAEIVAYVKRCGLTMVSYERLWATAMACKHAVEQRISGDFVECGVWRGGNAIVAAAVFKHYGDMRRVYLFDTFKGMTQPSSLDTEAATGASVLETYLQKQKETHNEWAYASLEEVRANFENAGVLSDRVIFVVGDVLQTLNATANLPAAICALRLDTDWYESTKKELEVLYPRLSVGGALIIDDYGYFTGARKATDEYFSALGTRPFLQYTDETGRLGVKFRD